MFPLEGGMFINHVDGIRLYVFASLLITTNPKVRWELAIRRKLCFHSCSRPNIESEYCFSQCFLWRESSTSFHGERPRTKRICLRYSAFSMEGIYVTQWFNWIFTDFYSNYIRFLFRIVSQRVEFFFLKKII